MGINDYNLPEMTTEQIEDLQDEVEYACAEMKAKLEYTAYLKRNNVNEFDCDHQWVARTQYALRMHNLLRQRVQRELKLRKELLEHERKVAWDRRFVVHAKAMLDSSTIKALIGLTNQDIEHRDSPGDSDV